MNYRPEGCYFRTAANQRYISSIETLTEAMEKGIILEARVELCDNAHNLIIDIPCCKGVIPREEGAVGISEGRVRDIALISRVNKTVCFKVTSIGIGSDGKPEAMLSRRAAQEECFKQYIYKLSCGDVIEARVTHIERFGCFVDIGCGISSMIPIDAISVSRISDPSDRFEVGQYIRAVVKGREQERVFLTHKELLGSWEQNAAEFEVGETVSGIVRSVEEYGIFVELAPNLAGLAEPKENVIAGQNVSVYIKAIIPDKMKIKLVIVDVCEDNGHLSDIRYFSDADHIDSWRYSTEKSGKFIGTVFE